MSEKIKEAFKEFELENPDNYTQPNEPSDIFEAGYLAGIKEARKEFEKEINEFGKSKEFLEMKEKARSFDIFNS